MTVVNKIGRFLTVFLLILICVGLPTFCVAADLESFVDKAANVPFTFEEDPADEFLAEKRELNKMVLKLRNGEKIDDNAFLESENKFRELLVKFLDKHQNDITDWDLAVTATSEFSGLLLENSLEDKFPYDISGYNDEELKKKLGDETAWKNFDAEINNIIQDNSLFFIPPKVIFRIDRKVFNMCKDILGESDAITLKKHLKLIQDYSLLGDSNTALKMEKKLVSKVKKVFGENSFENAELLKLMANDYKVIGDYRKCEETLLQLIELNKKLHGEETSIELAENFIELIALRRSTKDNDSETYAALEKATKNISDDDLYRLGYFNVEILNNPSDYAIPSDLAFNALMRDFQTKKFLDVKTRVNTNKWLDLSSVSKRLGIHSDAFEIDFASQIFLKFGLDRNNYRSAEIFCNLSDDCLILNQVDNALYWAEEALRICKKNYGDKHPCTIRTIHRLTNIYRKNGEYAKALSLDLQSYKLCKKIFTKTSISEAEENLTVIADIIEDYKGLKNYDAAIKYAEKILSKCPADDFKVMDIRNFLASMYNLQGDYRKALALYDYLKFSTNDPNDTYYYLDVFGISTVESANILAETFAALKNDKKALEFYEDSIDGYERLRFYNKYFDSDYTSSWFARVVPQYKKIAMYYLATGEVFEALETTERTKSRTLMENYRDLLAMNKSGLTEEEIYTLNEYRRKISQYKETFGKELLNGGSNLKFGLQFKSIMLMSNYNEYKRELRLKYPKYDQMTSNLTHQYSFLKSDQIENVLQPDSCYISFSVLKNESTRNNSSGEILAFVINDIQNIAGIKILADDNFFTACNIYRELLEYQNLEQMQNKYLWKLDDGSFKITKKIQQSVDAVLVNTEEDFDDARPELNSIVLSQGLRNKDFDGYITVGEWFGYNLNSDLVYLSACETGLGEYQSGEGIIGIPYALTVAGNKDTVMSLWKVDDTVTSKFVPTFFQKLREGKSEVQALNETKREFMKIPNPKFNNPSAWAPFLLYGF